VSRKSGLGRGLTSLIPPSSDEIEVVDPGTGLAEVPIDRIVANPNQPRRAFDEESLSELAASMKELGVLQPLLVRTVDDGYELIAGERRLRAARRAGFETVPVVVKEAEGVASLEQALVENLHRQDLNPLEEAAAYQRLIEQFGYTQEQVAERVGRSRSGVANLLRIFQLTPAVQRLVGDGLLSAGHAKALLGHPDRAYQEALAKRAVSEELTVRAVEDLVKERLRLESQTEQEPTGEQDAGAGDESGGGERKLRQPGLIELEELLASHLDTRVSISMASKRGKVTVEFADLEDLERIYRRIIAGQ
jgi:ParB family chromosome partitioning protein